MYKDAPTTMEFQGGFESQQKEETHEKQEKQETGSQSYASYDSEAPCSAPQTVLQLDGDPASVQPVLCQSYRKTHVL